MKAGLLFVFLVALTMRVYQLTALPVSLSVDEVSIGYASYSLLHTGRDEWGAVAPLVFYSLGDYKPPVNFYLQVPSIAIFGLTEMAVRLPTAMVGALTAVVFVI